MPVAIPDLTKLSLVHALVCVELSGKKTVTVPGDLLCLKIMAGKSKAPIFVRVGTHGNGGRHLHVELATSQYFNKTAPKPNAKRDVFDDLITSLIEQTGTAKFGATYVTRLDDLPKDNWLRATYFQMGDDGDVSVSLKGAEFAIKGTPYDFLKWSIVDQEKRIAEIRVGGQRDITFSAAYLVDCVNFANEGLKLFAGKTNEKPTRSRSASK